MEKYIFVRLSEFREYYFENRLYDFKIYFDNILDLYGYWKIGIVEFFILLLMKKIVIDKLILKFVMIFYYKLLFVYFDVCDFFSVNGY